MVRGVPRVLSVPTSGTGLCAGLEECEVRIERADEDDCTCEVNGAPVECP